MKRDWVGQGDYIAEWIRNYSIETSAGVVSCDLQGYQSLKYQVEQLMEQQR